MKHRIHDPLCALKNLRDQLLLSYWYDTANGTIHFVFVYPDKPAGADRAFIHLRFEGVSKFERLPGRNAELQGFVEAYSPRLAPGATEVEKIVVRAQEGHIRIALDFGLSFGGVSFECKLATAEARNARVTHASKDEWEYYDFDDGARFDFDEPFAYEMREGASMNNPGWPYGEVDAIHRQHESTSFPELRGARCSAFSAVLREQDQRLGLCHIELSGVWHRFYLDAGLLFWEGGSCPDPENDILEGERYIDLGETLCVVGVAIEKIEMYDCRFMLQFGNGARLVLMNKVQDTGAEVLKLVAGR